MTGRPLWDAGAQPERTYQAWTRTALAMAACGLLATRLTAGSGIGSLLLGVLGIVAALAVVRVQKRRLRLGRLGAAPGPVAAIAALTVLLALGALPLVLLR